MGYADGLLTSGERVVHREKQHWWVFVWGAKWTILAIIVAGLLFILGGNVASDGLAGTIKTLLGWASAIVLIGGLALVVWTTLQYFNQEYVLTNRRVIETQGVVNKRSADSSLEKINDAVLVQSVFGRALNFGDLKILTASEAAISEFKMIKNPIEFKKAMLEAKHEYEMEVAGGNRAPSPPLRAEPVATPGPVAGPVGDETVLGVAAGGASTASSAADVDPDEVTRTLNSLADLRDRGAISAEEYDRKKAELLGRL